MRLHEIAEDLAARPEASLTRSWFRRTSWPVGAEARVLRSGSLVYLYDDQRVHLSLDLDDLSATDWEVYPR